MSTRVPWLVSLLTIVACGTIVRTTSSAVAPTASTSSQSPATIVLENTSVAVKTMTHAVQLAGCLCKLVPFNAAAPNTLNARDLSSSIESPWGFAGPHGTVEMMAGYLTDEAMTGPQGLLLVDRPAWLLAVHDTPQVSSGPPDRPHMTQLSTVVYVYDAVTGASLVEFTYPEGSVTCPLPENGTPDRCGVG